MTTRIRNKLMSSAFAGLIAWVLLWSPAFTVNAQDYCVATNGNDSAAGTSWDVPFLTISNAIAKASAGQTVAVSNGTYVLTTQLLLNKGITLQGYGGASNTVMDANTNGRVITISSASAILDGFTIRNGSVSGNGGGISMSLGQVKNCIVTSNTISGTVNGGGVYMTGGILRDSTVGNNLVNPFYADGRGGGVYVSGGAIVTNCLISGNVIDNTTDLEWARGGGVCISDGTVVGCTITNNKVNRRWRNSSYGGGVYLEHANAMLDRCIVTGNEVSMLGGSDSGRLGGGLVIRVGVARNCLIAGNQARNQAGGVWMDGGTLESCTIVRNAAVTADYGGVYRGGGTVLNCIIWNNTSVGVAPNITNDTSVTYSCSPSLTSGTGNKTADPLFVDSGSGSGLSFTAGDYRPVIGSPCEKTGLVAGWMSMALDLAGLSRLNGIQSDMGCYLVTVPPRSTYVADNGNDLNAGTSWDSPFKTIQKGIDAATALGTVSVSNGTYVLTSQLTLGKACTLLGFGGRSNTIINANATGRIMTIDNANAVVDGFSLMYGKTATASFNGTGVNMTGGLLRNCLVGGCTNTASSAQGVGIYMTGGTVATCVIEKNRGSGAGVLGGGIFISGSSCLVTNCVITGNQVAQSDGGSKKGGGAYISAGRLMGSTISSNLLNQGRDSTSGGGGVFVTGSGAVSNCVIAANTLTCVDTTTRGGGVYVNGGEVTDCVISNNSGTGWAGPSQPTPTPTYGGGVYMTGTSLVERCIITRNYQNPGWTGARYGAGVTCDGGTMRSCLIMGNTANDLAGGLYITGGTNENCTIVRNNCSGGNYGGVYWTNTPVIVNAIVYNNTGAIENNILPIVGSVSGVTYSCAPSLTSGTGNVTGDPQFAASGSGFGTTFVAGDYRLVAGTPCRNKGLTEVRMKTATDLDRLPRVKDFLVDMGAYERQTASGSMIKFF